MFWKKSEFKSTIVSVVIHAIILLALLAFKITPEVDLNEYVTIGFGTIAKSNSSGSTQKSITTKVEPKKKDEVLVPKTKNVDKENEVVVAKPIEKKEDIKKEEIKDEGKKEVKETEEGEGNFGFELDFGGKGKRKIYSYRIPEYPPSVSKEIDVKLRFTIMPDGSVGRIIPIIKADTELEAAAMNSLRQWRFEPLPEGAKKNPQSVSITFPFRLQ
jgi:protein TonB